MIDIVYLLDTNALNKLTPAQRASDFVRHHCRVPEEVLHEAEGLSDHGPLRELEYAVSPLILERVKEVMATLPVGDHRLVDLYRNEGNADPLLVATALAADPEERTLWPTQWCIVTDDNALRAKAQEFSVCCLHSAEFVRLLAAGLAVT